MQPWISIPAVSGVGFTGAVLALLLWPFRNASEAVDTAFSILAGLAGLCGLAILLLTAFDMIFHRRRGERVKPLRAFDLALAIGLLALGASVYPG